MIPIAFVGESRRRRRSRSRSRVQASGTGITGAGRPDGRVAADRRRRELRVRAQLAGHDAESTSRWSPCRCPTARGSIGVIVISKLGLSQFDEDDMRLLEVLAGHAAVALENAGSTSPHAARPSAPPRCSSSAASFRAPKGWTKSSIVSSSSRPGRSARRALRSGSRRLRAGRFACARPTAIRSSIETPLADALRPRVGRSVLLERGAVRGHRCAAGCDHGRDRSAWARRSPSRRSRSTAAGSAASSSRPEDGGFSERQMRLLGRRRAPGEACAHERRQLPEPRDHIPRDGRGPR